VKASKALPGLAGRRAPRPVSSVRVFARPGTATGRLVAGALVVPCTLGRNGATRDKREGDGCTPRGAFEIVDWYAPPGPPRLPRRHGMARIIKPTTGWCDDPDHPSYNRPVILPLAARHEGMTRTDGKYDIVGVLSWNIRPRIRGRGSAIFLHLNESRTKGTEGCVALTRADMRRLLPRLGRRVRLTVM
jgi:L,D-peptidoglycan transpeptidase YkuD (ErfK/YbiS/YcfS/YnhG family)